MTTPPTPAEVAEARAWFDGHPDRANEIGTYYVDSWTEEYAAVLVRYALAFGERAALAAPAEQPREDDCPTCHGSGVEHDPGYYVPGERFVEPPSEGPCGECYGSGSRKYREGWDAAEQPREDDPLMPELWWEPGEGVIERYRDVWRMVESGDHTAPPSSRAVRLAAARSVSPSAVPAVSAGGAGRDLTAQDVRDAWSAGCEVESGQAIRQFLADYLNRIARPADTGTQATEQTTEYRAVLVDRGREYALGVGDEGFALLRETFGSPLARGAMVIEQRSVSPWSPVAVHDENGAQR